MYGHIYADKTTLTPRDKLVGQLDGHIKVGQVQVIPGAVAEGHDAGLRQRGIAVCAKSGRQSNHGLLGCVHVPHVHHNVWCHVTHMGLASKVQLLTEFIQVLQNSLERTNLQHD